MINENTPAETSTKKSTEKMLVSKWLEDYDSHTIYESQLAKASCEEFTGVIPRWPEHTPQDTASAMRARGLGGTLRDSPSGRLCYGWEMAESLAVQLIPEWRSSGVQGRGRRFWFAVESLANAGK